MCVCSLIDYEDRLHKHCSRFLPVATVFYILCDPLWAADQAGWPTTLRVRNGLVTIDTQGATIEQIIRAVGQKAGFDVRLLGNLDEPANLFVENMPLARFLGKLAKRHSLIVIENPTASVSGKEPDRQIAAVYIVANSKTRMTSQEISREVSGKKAQEDKAPEDEAILEARRVLEESLDNRTWATPGERKAAIESLALSADKRSINILERVVARETNLEVREDVMNALANIDGQEATMALARISLGNFSPQARRLAIRALATREGDIPRSFITKALEDHSASVRGEAASALNQ